MPSKKIILVLIVVIALSSIAIAGEANATDFWSNIINGIEQWFKISPFNGMFASPEKQVSTVSITFYPEDYTLEPTKAFDASAGDFHIYGFRGKISFNRLNDTLTLEETEGTTKIVTSPANNMTVTNLILSHFSLSNIELVITRGNWTETTREGSAEFTDFSGKADIYADHIVLYGNVSRITKK